MQKCLQSYPELYKDDDDAVDINEEVDDSTPRKKSWHTPPPAGASFELGREKCGRRDYDSPIPIFLRAMF